MTSMHGIPFEKHETIRLGLIGAGGRGLGQLHELLACEGFEITAVADTDEAAGERAKQQVVDAGKKAPIVFSGKNAWQQLLDLDLDLAYIATGWDSHTPISVAAMKSGKHAAVEVPAAVTLDDCWQLVETSEATGRHCVMLENCCYDYWETIVKHMVKAGVLGQVTHAECAYIHDLRSMLLQDRGEGLWRRDPHITRDSNHYPTHGLGPVAQILGIGEEDAFDYMVSMSSRSAALAEFRDATLPANDPKRQETYVAGDMNTSLIRTKLGRTIVLQHTVTLPRPYDRNFLISGTRGTFRDLPPRLFIDGVSQGEEWLPLEPYKEQFEDPLWRQFGAQARALGGHGGMDYIMNYRLMQLMQQGLPPDMDVYDAADWSVPGALSEQSVLQRSAVVSFPDFRRYQTF